MSADEIWRTVAELPLYEVSNLGRIRSHHNKSLRTLSPRLDRDGYAVVDLTTAPGVRVRRMVHRLVAIAFIGDPQAGQVTRHLNGNAADNRAINLAFGTQSENVYDAVAHGTHAMARRTHCPVGHEYDVHSRWSGRTQRRCSTCMREQAADRRARRRAERAA